MAGEHGMLKVLYVEDEALLAISMEAALERAGWVVRLAHDGEQGLAQAAAFVPDVIVTDHMMPRMDGPTMLRHLAHRDLKAPAVLTTARSRSDITADDMSLIAVFLAKPFSEEDLIEAVSKCLAL
ncbi:MAG: response regulator [Alphaproteobacteria bacterium]|nr:MAG: response regulator [Alphaproteobacteria bacterium]